MRARRVCTMILCSVGLLVLEADAHEDDLELALARLEIFGCAKASRRQIATVNQGNAQKDRFLERCAEATEDSPWCAQLIRPNPDSLPIFRCTYGERQIHQLIHPDERSWSNAYAAVNLIHELQKEGLEICQIYNWWRPEPYNRNVGGAPGRHPFATSVDVLFCNKEDQETAFLRLCEWRKAGRLQALGYYSSHSLHFGVGDSRANTWGKACP